VEALAKEAYRTLKMPSASENAALDRLSGILFDPLGDFEETRLVVVADGPLAHIPFAALADPRAAGTRLVESVEIVRLPSASLIPQLRAQRSGRKFHRLLAIAADPAYGSAFPRLAESRREAEQIAALVAPGEVEVVTGVEARRDWVQQTDFSRFRYLHFATHGVVDDERPELSGIVLSLVDEKGASSDGFLRLHDVYNLKLPVDLVVLSACETGLGKEVAGEGLIGLVRGFMYAGAPAVIAASWKVDDVATALLMTELYRGLFAGESPPAALRLAQDKVSRIPRFRSPYYWAAFELQGDWR
jgi:CHAT domain-containing protein